MSKEQFEAQPQQQPSQVPDPSKAGVQFDLKSLLFFAVVAAVLIVGAIVLESRM
ncbi:MAG: hypothetical protein QM765_13760 [Myxococcales bacterium]